MFFPGSRYFKLTPFLLPLPDGTMVPTTRVASPGPALVRGYYPRPDGQRLDSIAAHFLNDATASWQLCDANDSVVPDALAVHNLIAIPGEAAS